MGGVCGHRYETTVPLTYHSLVPPATLILSGLRQEGFESYIELALAWSRYKIFVNNNKVGLHVFEWSLLSDKSEK